MKRKFFTFGMVFSILVFFLGMNLSSSMIYDNVRILFDGNGLDAGDQKLILLVDVPDNGGGLATDWFLYEITNIDDVWIYEQQDGSSQGPTVIGLDNFNFIIIINSDSDGVGATDEWSMYLRGWEDGSETCCTALYQFGDSLNSDYRMMLFEMDNVPASTKDISIHSIAGWRWGGAKEVYSSYYNDEDFTDLFWGYISAYRLTGAESSIASLLETFSFPDPALS